MTRTASAAQRPDCRGRSAAGIRTGGRQRLRRVKWPVALPVCIRSVLDRLSMREASIGHRDRATIEESSTAMVSV